MIKIHYKDGTHIVIELNSQKASDYLISTILCDQENIVLIEQISRAVYYRGYLND